MVHRVPTRCHTCGNVVLLRIAVAGGDQPFVFPCPHCGTEQHGRFYAEPGGPFDLRSDDLVVVEQEPRDALAVPIATDMPVHTSLIGTTTTPPPLTPFMQLASTLGNDAIEPLMDAVEKLRARRRDAYAPLRRAAGFFARGDPDGVREVLASMPGGEPIKSGNHDPLDLFERAVALLYEPFEDVEQRRRADEELLRLGAKARSRPQQLRDLFADYDAGPLREHRHRVVRAAFDALGDTDALYPALWVARMEGRVDLSEYRVMRDDFATRKALYQDLFELGSRTLAFTAPIANLALRGDAFAFADGKTRTPHTARKTTAFNREPWLADYPEAASLYDAMWRHTRNDIGHALVRHDIARGVLIYEDGREQNYLLFLVDALAGVRLSHYLLDVVQLLDYIRPVQPQSATATTR